jgi:hypothetical protein
MYANFYAEQNETKLIQRQYYVIKNEIFFYLFKLNLKR